MLMIWLQGVPQSQKSRPGRRKVFDDATFTILKWHSNVPELEPKNKSPSEISELTYVKSQLAGIEQPEGKLLGVLWDRKHDIIRVTLTPDAEPVTKRSIFSKLARIYDPLGLASPPHWPENLFIGVRVTVNSMGRRPTRATTKEMEGMERNARVLYNPSVLSLIPSTNSRDHLAWIRRCELKRRLCGCLWSSQTRRWGYPGIGCSKSRIVKRNLSIPRLELISGHMTVKKK